MRFRLVLSLLAAFLGTALAVSVFLPWFHLPILGLSIPTPAWGKAGVACLAAASTLFLRALGGSALRWLVRPALIPAAYFWWTSLEQMQAWGARSLAPAQLKLATVNQGLGSLGGEPITLYEPALWRGLEPSYGWQVAGAILVLSALFTLFDGPRMPHCGSCNKRGREGDSFCFQCGQAFSEQPVCSNCGQTAIEGDAFCRHCAKPLP
ncbi:MAG: zinc ribbon domain-containing protein [Vulcanimicrobiota bacterium]